MINSEIIVRPTLTAEELAERDRLDKIIEAGQDTFIEVIRAMRIYRDRKLYRDQYDTFEQFLGVRYHKIARTKQRASQLIGWVDVRDSLSGQPGVDVLPENERQTRELASLHNPVEQTAVWLNAQVASASDQPSNSWIKESISVLEEIKVTDGYVDTGDPSGKMYASTAALIQRMAEKKERQRAYINAKKSPPVAKSIMTAGDLFNLEALTWADSSVTGDQQVVVVVYKYSPT